MQIVCRAITSKLSPPIVIIEFLCSIFYSLVQEKVNYSINSIGKGTHKSN